MKIHLAGMEDHRYARMAVAAGHKYGLASYFNLRRLTESAAAEHSSFMNRHDVDLILDSGIFSMMFGSESGKTYDLAWMLEYARKYIAFASSYRVKRLVIVECDVHKILGMPAVFELRKLFRDSGLEVMYVWHVEEGIDGLLELAVTEKYISLGAPELRRHFSGTGIDYKSGLFSLLSKIDKHCASRGVPLPKIHLLGNTVEKTMRTRIAFSCDSTSWMAGMKFGAAVVYRNGSLLKIHLRSKAMDDLKKQVEAERPEIIDLINSYYKTEKRMARYLPLFISADSFRKYQQWLDAHYTWKGNQNAKQS